VNSSRTLNLETSEPQDGRRIYRVSELTRLIRVALENEFGSIWVEGEISNVHPSTPGHIYFTLKDESAQIKAALFRGDRRAVRVELRDGLKVRVFGEITAYEQRSEYQIIVKQVEEAGLGSLQEAFEKLKKKLAAEGLFDAARKKPLPMLPRRIGIVTSPTGAAIRDILNILTRRFPNLYVLVAPVKVQGEGASAEIAAAIDLLNARGGLDVLIVGRGGGSLEDLWAFNEEVVARAIARSRLPVISAVGHEIDFTISDFVADLRAPTPSAAAELVVRPKADFEKMLSQLAVRLTRGLRQRALEWKNRLLKVERSEVFREPVPATRGSPPGGSGARGPAPAAAAAAAPGRVGPALPASRPGVARRPAAGLAPAGRFVAGLEPGRGPGARIQYYTKGRRRHSARCRRGGPG
jgi:exodeoxyribonuclease VII large subunit